jgi:hypothetical protein
MRLRQGASAPCGTLYAVRSDLKSPRVSPRTFCVMFLVMLKYIFSEETEAGWRESIAPCVPPKYDRCIEECSVGQRHRHPRYERDPVYQRPSGKHIAVQRHLRGSCQGAKRPVGRRPTASTFHLLVGRSRLEVPSLKIKPPDEGSSLPTT